MGFQPIGLVINDLANTRISKKEKVMKQVVERSETTPQEAGLLNLGQNKCAPA